MPFLARAPLAHEVSPKILNALFGVEGVAKNILPFLAIHVPSIHGDVEGGPRQKIYPTIPEGRDLSPAVLALVETRA